MGCSDRRSGKPGTSSTVIAHMEPPSSRKQAKRVRLGPERPLLGPRMSSEGPGGADLVPTTLDWPAWVGFMVTTHLDLVSGLFWAQGGLKGLVSAPKGLFADLGGPRRAPVGQIWFQLPSNGLIGSSGGSWDQICPPWALRGPPGPQKGPFGAQTNPFCLFSRAGWFHMGYNSAG